MSTRPDLEPEFAVQDTTENATVKGTIQQLKNKEEIPAALIQEGFKYKQALPFNIFNAILNLAFLWIKHLNERYSSGDIFETQSTETDAQIIERLGGGWTRAADSNGRKVFIKD